MSDRACSLLRGGGSETHPSTIPLRKTGRSYLPLRRPAYGLHAIARLGAGVAIHLPSILYRNGAGGIDSVVMSKKKKISI